MRGQSPLIQVHPPWFTQPPAADSLHCTHKVLTMYIHYELSYFVLYDSAVQKLLDEAGLSLLDAANKSERHNITRPEALAAQARAASGVSAQVAGRQTALSGCCHGW